MNYMNKPADGGIMIQTMRQLRLVTSRKYAGITNHETSTRYNG